MATTTPQDDEYRLTIKCVMEYESSLPLCLVLCGQFERKTAKLGQLDTHMTLDVDIQDDTIQLSLCSS